MKNSYQREKSPLTSTKNSICQKDSKLSLKSNGFGVSDTDFEKTRKERIERREGLEKRLGTLTCSLQADFQKVRTRVLH